MVYYSRAFEWIHKLMLATKFFKMFFLMKLEIPKYENDTIQTIAVNVQTKSMDIYDCRNLLSSR